MINNEILGTKVEQKLVWNQKNKTLYGLSW
jgi:hypothetical protein